LIAPPNPQFFEMSVLLLIFSNQNVLTEIISISLFFLFLLKSIKPKAKVLMQFEITLIIKREIC